LFDLVTLTGHDQSVLGDSPKAGDLDPIQILPPTSRERWLVWLSPMVDRSAKGNSAFSGFSLLEY
jgi:hypothetical protein